MEIKTNNKDRCQPKNILHYSISLQFVITVSQNKKLRKRYLKKIIAVQKANRVYVKVIKTLSMLTIGNAGGYVAVIEDIVLAQLLRIGTNSAA